MKLSENRYINVLGIATIVALFGVLPTHAQQRNDTTIAGQTIEIIQTYKPEIAKPVKPVINPTLPAIDTSKPKFDYVVPQQTLSYNYNSVPIRPLALGKKVTESTLPNYIKAGFGNLSSIYLDGGLGSFKGEDYEALVHLNYLSQKGQIVNQQSSAFHLDAGGKYFTAGHELSARLDVLRNGNTFYGYDHDSVTHDKQEIRQLFWGTQLQVGAANTQANAYDINYQPTFRVGLYGDAYRSLESHFEIDIPASKVIDSNLTLSMGLKGNLTNLRTDSFEAGNNFFQINPAADIRFEQTQMHVGLSPTWGKGGIAYLLPDIQLSSRFFNEGLQLQMGWKALLIQNTYQQLSTKNPFIHNLYDVAQTKSDQIYAGFSTHIKEHITFGSTVSWRQWKNMAQFVNDYILDKDGKRFAVVYDSKVQAIGIDAFFRYQVGNFFGVGANLALNNFYHTETFDKVYHEPVIRIGGNMYIHPLEALRININTDYWDGMRSRQADGTSRRIPGFFDLSAGAEYSFIPELSVFLQFSNILGMQYQRWNQYQVYGFQVIGGLRFKF